MWLTSRRGVMTGQSPIGDCVKRFFPLHVISIIHLVWKRLSSSLIAGWNLMVQSGDLATQYLFPLWHPPIYSIITFIILNNFGSRFLNSWLVLYKIYSLPTDVSETVYMVGAQDDSGWAYLLEKYGVSMCETEKRKFLSALASSKDSKTLSRYIFINRLKVICMYNYTTIWGQYDVSERSNIALHWSKVTLKTFIMLQC